MYNFEPVLIIVHVHNKCNIHIIYSNILNFKSFSAEKLLEHGTLC